MDYEDDVEANSFNIFRGELWSLSVTGGGHAMLFAVLTNHAHGASLCSSLQGQGGAAAGEHLTISIQLRKSSQETRLKLTCDWQVKRISDFEQQHREALARLPQVMQDRFNERRKEASAVAGMYPSAATPMMS